MGSILPHDLPGDGDLLRGEGAPARDLLREAGTEGSIDPAEAHPVQMAGGLVLLLVSGLLLVDGDDGTGQPAVIGGEARANGFNGEDGGDGGGVGHGRIVLPFGGLSSLRDTRARRAGLGAGQATKPIVSAGAKVVKPPGAGPGGLGCGRG